VRTDQWGTDWTEDELIKSRKVCNECHKRRRCANCCVTCKRPCGRQVICEVMRPWATDASPFGFTDEQWQAAYDDLKRTPDTWEKIRKLHDYDYKARTEAHNKAMDELDKTGFDVMFQGRKIAHVESTDIPQDHISEITEMVEKELDSSHITPAANKLSAGGPERRNDGAADVDVLQEKALVSTIDKAGELVPQVNALAILNDKAEFEGYPKGSRDAAYARLEIVKTWMDEKAKAKVAGHKVGELEKSFIRQLLHGQICYSATETLKRNGEIKLSIRSIYRWEKAWKDNTSIYPINLVDKYSRTRADKDQQYVRTWIKMQAADPRNRSITDIVREANNNIPGFDMSYRTVARIVEATRKDRLLTAAITGPTAYKNNARPHIRRINDCQPGDKFEADGKTMNVLVMSPFWFHHDKSLRYIVRPVIVCWLDVATWMITGWATWLSESWHLVRTSFVDSMSKCGVPRVVTYDGGGSFHNIYTNPEWFAERKRDSAAVRKARELVAKGYKGFYEAFGVEKQVKTIPGNSESKQIEPAWGDIFADWEKRQFAYVGKNFMARPEWMRMTNLKLIKTYKDKIMTWDEYTNSIGEYINEWNNRPRPSLKRLDGSMASPVEAYMEFSDHIRKPAQEVVEHVCWHPRKLNVNRDGVNLDGLLYHHPGFGVFLGQSVLVEYDERNRFQCSIATQNGEKMAVPAKLVIPGMHMDDEQSQKAMIDRAHYEKELKAVYLARVNHGDAMTMQEFNSLTARVDQLLEDQSRRQEREKDAAQLPLAERRIVKNLPVPELDAGFESVEEDIAEIAETASCATINQEPDGDDALLDEINKELGNIGLRRQS